MAFALQGLGTPTWALLNTGASTTAGVPLTNGVTIPTNGDTTWAEGAINFAPSGAASLTTPRPAASWAAMRVGGSINGLLGQAGVVGGGLAVAILGQMWLSSTQYIAIGLFRTADEDPERLYWTIFRWTGSSTVVVFDGRDTNFMPVSSGEDSPHVDVYVAVGGGQVIFGWGGLDRGSAPCGVSAAGPRNYTVSADSPAPGEPGGPWYPARGDRLDFWYGVDAVPPWTPASGMGMWSLQQRGTSGGTSGGWPRKHGTTGSWPLAHQNNRF